MKWTGPNPPLGFQQLCSGLHQDALFGAEDITELAANALRFVAIEQRPSLQAFLGALSDATPDEISDLFDQSSADLRFDPAAAREFTSEVVKLLA
jgi:hypothetical protein